MDSNTKVYSIKVGPDQHEFVVTNIGWLSQAAKMVQMINVANGWFDSDRSFGDDIALLHSEVSETLEAFRSWGAEDTTMQMCMSRGKHSKNIDDPNEHLCKPEGVGSELADVLVRLLDTCIRYGVDLEDEFNRKLQFNATRGHRHGGKRL